jgi:hypothetical protein
MKPQYDSEEFWKLVNDKNDPMLLNYAGALRDLERKVLSELSFDLQENEPPAPTKSRTKRINAQTKHRIRRNTSK